MKPMEQTTNRILEVVREIVSQTNPRGDVYLFGMLFLSNPSLDNLKKFASALFPVEKEGKNVYRVGQTYEVVVSPVNLLDFAFQIIEASDLEDIVIVEMEGDLDVNIEAFKVTGYPSVEREMSLTDLSRRYGMSTFWRVLSEILDSTPLGIPALTSVDIPELRDIVKELRQKAEIYLVVLKILLQSEVLDEMTYFYAILLGKTLLYSLYKPVNGIFFLSYFVFHPGFPYLIEKTQRGDYVVSVKRGGLFYEDRELNVNFPIPKDLPDVLLYYISGFVTGEDDSRMNDVLALFRHYALY